MKFSIITTTFNSIKTIEKCVNSLKSQSYNNIELIWIDNNSSDGTYEYLKGRCDKNTKLISIKNTKIPDAWNIGIDCSKGDVICFLNSDDQYFSKNTILDVAKLFLKIDINIIYSDIVYIRENNKIFRNWISDKNNLNIKNNNYFKNKIAKGWMPPHPGFFVKKNIIEKIGKFNTKYKISFDYDFIVRCLKNENVKAVYLNSKTVKMLVGGNSNKFKNILCKMKEDLQIIKENKIGNSYTLIYKNLSKLPQFII